MLELAKLQSALEALPLFPLPTAVLLPYEMLPLHVFEPRYRALVEELLAHDRPLAVAQLAAGWEGEYEGRPRVEPICGAGFIARHEKLPDGRYNLLVRGVARVRLVGELPATRPFREAVAELVEDVLPDPAALEEAQESVRRMLFALCASRPGPGSSALAQLASRAPGPAALADIVIAALVTDVARRRLALVTPEVGARLALAQTSIAELLVAGASEEHGLRN